MTLRWVLGYTFDRPSPPSRHRASHRKSVRHLPLQSFLSHGIFLLYTFQLTIRNTNFWPIQMWFNLELHVWHKQNVHFTDDLQSFPCRKSSRAVNVCAHEQNTGENRSAYWPGTCKRMRSVYVRYGADEQIIQNLFFPMFFVYLHNIVIAWP